MQLKINNEKTKKYKNKILLSSVLILLISLAIFLTTSIHWGLIENDLVFNIKNYGFSFYDSEDREIHKFICILFTIFFGIVIISLTFGIISILKMKNDNLIYNLNDNKITHNVSEKVLNLEEKNLKISIYKNKEIDLRLIKNVGFIKENHIKKGFFF